MPAWWSRKSHNSNKSPISSPDKRSSEKLKNTLVDESPRKNSRELGATGSSCGGSSGFSAFDSDGGVERKGHPLPRPVDHGVGFGSGSNSVSSESSSGSSDESPSVPDHAQFGGSRPRSLPAGSRGAITSTSPLHPRMAGMGLDSPAGRQEDMRSQCHPLPLPPSSPTSPSGVHNGRVGFFAESTHIMLPKWKKGRLLGRGTFGHVYLGFNSESGQMCAIKEVKIVSDDQNSRECLKQLNQEINLLSQLSHPNIVRYYGSDLCEETLSVYLEYVSGGSIHKLLQEYGPFKEPVIQNYTRQILSGLAYLHSRNTLHRDIKGANILVDPNGEIKLADFGMAKHINSSTSVLSFKGSPYWMAPEVVMNTNGYNLAVDIWSLGCTILEMATSKPPWSQYEGVAAIFKIGNSKDIPEIPDHLSSEAKSFLKLCFQRDPSARPSAAQLLDHPFVKDQASGRILHINAIKEAVPFAFDGSFKPAPLDIHQRRKSISSYDADNIRRLPTTIWDTRENARSITSLPVSPCSSPLRQNGPAYKSCFLSPPHPSYARTGHTGHNANDYLISPPRTRPSFPDPWIESTLFKAQTPNGPHGTRLV